MSYPGNLGNPQQPARQPGPARKIKRVSDVNAMGASIPTSPAFPQSPYDAASPQQFAPNNLHLSPHTPSQFNVQSPNQNFYSPNMQPQMQNQQANYDFNQYGQQQQYGQSPMNPNQPPQQQNQQFPGQFSMFQQPMVQNMAMDYGQKLAEQGKELVNKEFEKYIPVTKLKYYFAVDNNYVLKKLRLLFFPFVQKDWSLKYDQDNPVQPRYDVNAPDLYIPTMGYITYVVLAGLILGMQDRFSPEQLGIQASTALGYTLFELVVYSITLYVANLSTTLRTLDLLAFSGYKFAIIVAILLVSILLQKTGYWIMFLYCSCTIFFFSLRTLKAKVMSEPVQSATDPQMGGYDAYGQPTNNQHFDHSLGRKRKLYFLFLVAICQPILSFCLTKHLIPPSIDDLVGKNL